MDWEKILKKLKIKILKIFFRNLIRKEKAIKFINI